MLRCYGWIVGSLFTIPCSLTPLIAAPAHLSVLSQIWAAPGNRGRRLSALIRALRWFVRCHRSPSLTDPVLLPVFDQKRHYPCHVDSIIAKHVMYRSEWFDWDMLQFLRSYLQPSDHFLDIGANTGKFSMQCLAYNNEVKMSLVDLGKQLDVAKANLDKHGYTGRFTMIEHDMLNNAIELPGKFEVIWMSQFLDCFSEKEIISILMRCQNALSENGRVFILEPFWDRQRFETASFCLQQTSLYFTSMANGNSQMYHSGTFLDCVRKAGFDVEEEINDLGLSHTLLKLKKSKLN